MPDLPIVNIPGSIPYKHLISPMAFVFTFFHTFEYHFVILSCKVFWDLLLIFIYVYNDKFIYLRQNQPGLTTIMLCTYSIYGIVGYVFNSDLYHKRLACEIENAISVIAASVFLLCGCLKAVHIISNFSPEVSRKGWFNLFVRKASFKLLPSNSKNNLDANIDVLIKDFKMRKLLSLVVAFTFILLNLTAMTLLQNYWVIDKFVNDRWCKNLEPEFFTILTCLSIAIFIGLELRKTERKKDVFLMLPQICIKGIGITAYSVLGALDWFYRYKYNDYLIPPEMFLYLTTIMIANSSVFPIVYHHYFQKKLSIYRFEFAWNDFELRKQMVQICQQSFVIQYMYFLMDTDPSVLYGYNQKELKKLTIKYFSPDSPYFIEMDYFLVWNLRQDQVEVSGLINVRKALIAIIKDEILPYLSHAPRNGRKSSLL